MINIVKNVLGFKNQKIHSIDSEDFKLRDLYNYNVEDSDDDEDNISNRDEETGNSGCCESYNPLSFYEKIAHHIVTCAKDITYTNIKTFTRWILDHAALNVNFQISLDDILLLMTFYILLVPNIVFLLLPESTDYVFTAITTFAFSLLIVELVANTWSKSSCQIIYKEFLSNFGIYYLPNNMQFQGYVFTFFWFIDVLVIISLFPDIPAIATAFHFGNQSSAHYIKTARVIRLIRLFRIIKTYKDMVEKQKFNEQRWKYLTDAMSKHGQLSGEGQSNLRNSNAQDSFNAYEELDYIDIKTKRESKIGEKLTKSTTIRVAILIILFIVVLPFFIYAPENNGLQYSTNLFQSVNEQHGMSNDAKAACISSLIRQLELLNAPTLFLRISPYSNISIVNNVQSLETLRSVSIVSKSSVSNFNITSQTTYSTNAKYNIDSFLKIQNIYTLYLTLLLAAVLLVANYVFTYDTQKLVLKPIERMLQLVEKVAKNPLANLSFDVVDGHGSYETNLLEKTFVKITGLLRVCFGEAGAGIIKANLAISDTSKTAIINPLLPGVRVYCIVGFCDIHRFDFVMKRLGQDVLVFVNTVAGIVHENVHQWDGSCNKNLGNAFVVIWRIGEENELRLALKSSQNALSHSLLKAARIDSIRKSGMKGKQNPSKKLFKSDSGGILNNPSNRSFISNSTKDTNGTTNYQQIDLKRIPGVDRLAAKALIAYLKIIMELNQNESIAQYAEDGRLTDISNIPFHLRMGFGLHAGWAIEGAVGSLQKVDATYLSPHINMAARLETASRQYGVPLLVSQDFYDLLSPYIHAFMRRLDVVTVKGSENPIGIYTYDTLLQKRRLNYGNRRRGISRVKFGENDTNLPRKSSMDSLTSSRGSGGGSVTSQDEYPSAVEGCSPELSSDFIMPASPTKLSTETSYLDLLTTSNPSTAATTATLSSSSPSAAIAAAVSITVLTRSILTEKKQSDRDFRRANSLGKRLIENRNFTSADEPEKVFDKDPDLIYLRSHIKLEFKQLFQEGVNKYIAGDWTAAKLLFERTDRLMLENEIINNKSGDGPSRTLLKYMAAHGNIPPIKWKGFRPLTSK